MSAIGDADQLKMCSEYRGPLPLILAWTLSSTATIIVIGRMYVKFGLRHTVGWDDYTIIIALLLAIADNIVFTKMFQAGVGRHIFCLSEQQAFDCVKWSTIAQILEVLAIAFMKISVVLFIQKVIDKASYRLSQFLWVLIGFIVVAHFVPFMLYILQCRPLPAVWDPNVQGSCYSAHLTYTAAYIAIGLDAFTDLACSAIPIFIVARLQMGLRMKISICVLMGLGVLTAACAIGKAVYLNGVFAEDYTWAITTPAIWSIAETQLGMNIASVPALRPLFSKIAELSSRWTSIFTSRPRSSRKSSSKGSKERFMEKKYSPHIRFHPEHMHTGSVDSDRSMLPIPAKAPKVHTGFTRVENSVMGPVAYDEEYGFGEIIAKHESS